MATLQSNLLHGSSKYHTTEQEIFQQKLRPIISDMFRNRFKGPIGPSFNQYSSRLESQRTGTVWILPNDVPFDLSKCSVIRVNVSRKRKIKDFQVLRIENERFLCCRFSEWKRVASRHRAKDAATFMAKEPRYVETHWSVKYCRTLKSAEKIRS